ETLSQQFAQRHDSLRLIIWGELVEKKNKYGNPVSAYRIYLPSDLLTGPPGEFVEQHLRDKIELFEKEEERWLPATSSPLVGAVAGKTVRFTSKDRAPAVVFDRGEWREELAPAGEHHGFTLTAYQIRFAPELKD
ncbi:MAG: hypothetical protein ABIH03_05380, partial [Pseudomonadota bacterium]